MAEYIEREAAIRVVNEQSSFTMTRSGLIDSISKLPAADVAPVRHGSWLEVIEKRLFGEHYFLCSNCKSRNGLMIPFNYCPNCGTKMDEGKV